VYEQPDSNLHYKADPAITTPLSHSNNWIIRDSLEASQNNKFKKFVSSHEWLYKNIQEERKYKKQQDKVHAPNAATQHN
jgi:hypothetical protein